MHVLLPVARRVWVVAGINRVLVADLPVAAVDEQLAAASVLDDAAAALDRLRLRDVV